MGEKSLKVQSQLAQNPYQIDRASFQKLSEALHASTGIFLADTPKNHTLISSRLQSLVKVNGCESLEEFTGKVLESKKHNSKLFRDFVEKMTTNTTHFFREASHFEYFALEIKRFAQENPDKEIRLWCSAASTGQEPYTLAMVMCETLSEGELTRVKFLATDIDTKVLEKAAEGIYSESQIGDLAKYYVTKYFDKIERDGEVQFRVKPKLSKLVRYANLNLMEEAYPFQYKFQFVFCRNVLIYFQQKDINHVISSTLAHLAEHGLLFVGHSESGTVRNSAVRAVLHAVYRKVKP